MPSWWRYILPNILTSANLCAGVAAVLLAVEGRLELACWLIVWCVLFDKADGVAARLLKATSDFGAQFDSFADLVAFGVAPGLVAYLSARTLLPGGPTPTGLAAGGSAEPALAAIAHLLLVVGVAFFILAAAVRLARFNCLGHVPGLRYFLGVPTTFCGAIVSTSLLVHQQHALPASWLGWLPLLLLLLAVGMVSGLPVPKVLPRPNRLHNLVQLVLIVATYLAGFSMRLPEFLLGLCGAYLLIGTAHAYLLVPASARRPGPTAATGGAA